mgnify:CR=1 FL=1
MSLLPLTIATTDYDHFRDFRLGTVKAEGIDPNWLLLGHHECFARFTADPQGTPGSDSRLLLAPRIQDDRDRAVRTDCADLRTFRSRGRYDDLSQICGLQRGGSRALGGWVRAKNDRLMNKTHGPHQGFRCCHPTHFESGESECFSR